MEPADSNKARVTQFLDDLSHGRVESAIAAYATDGDVETMGETLISGVTDFPGIPDAIRGILQVFPDGITFTIKSMVAEGDKVAVEASSLGEHVSGKTYSNDYHFLFEFRDGKLLHLREYMDTERVTEVLCNGMRPPYSLDD
ncbi:nuclear transport factor 2 family protein [Haliea atlantica]|jgi:hypothetical protein|nr:hypothetical protein [Haliea sp.]MAL94026.1 hypothetical protein [Haliea sp.]|tara:strand:+ start:204138 stop:204563 length:426 start_codon:yes stop_codon:yes gene_type:complete